MRVLYLPTGTRQWHSASKKGDLIHAGAESFADYNAFITININYLLKLPLA
jgi:hypothetical protein